MFEDQQSLSQLWPRKDSMSLWLTEERKVSSSSSEKQICLLSVTDSFLVFLRVCPASGSSWFSWALCGNFGVGGGTKEDRVHGRRGAGAVRWAGFWFAMWTGFWGKAGTVSPSHIALMLKKWFEFRKIQSELNPPPVQGSEKGVVEVPDLLTSLWTTSPGSYQRPNSAPVR